jgi:hypothetical protein
VSFRVETERGSFEVDFWWGSEGDVGVEVTQNPDDDDHTHLNQWDVASREDFVQVLVEQLGATTEQAEAMAEQEWEAGYSWARESYEGSLAAEWKREAKLPRLSWQQALADLSIRLANILNTVTPEEVALAATPRGGITIVAGEAAEKGVEVLPAWPPESFALAVLKELQEAVVERVGAQGWPSSDPTAPSAKQPSAGPPEPGVEVVEGELRCWYGSRDQPALALPAIPLRRKEPLTRKLRHLLRARRR